MMNPSNGKGDKQRKPAADNSHVDAEMDRLFPKDKRETGKFKVDEETGQMISSQEWDRKYYIPRKRTHYIVGDIEPYTSPIDGKVIASRKQNREDLIRNNCRQWEGTEQETRVAEQVKAEQESKFENSIGDMVESTFHDMKEGRIAPDKSGKVDFTFGMD